MSGDIGSTNRRPTKDLAWGVGSPTFGTDFIEPSAPKKLDGFDPGEKIPYQWLNWMFNNLWAWIKNLDARTARQPFIHWVCDPSANAIDRDFSTLAEVIAAVNSYTAYGHTILIRGSHTLEAELTISASCHLIFDPGATIYKGYSNPGDYSALKIDTGGVWIEGGIWYGWDGDGSPPFKHTWGANCKISKISLSWGVTKIIDDSEIDNGDVASITQVFKDI